VNDANGQINIKLHIEKENSIVSLW